MANGKQAALNALLDGDDDEVMIEVGGSLVNT
jgi:hypothetical protein